MTHTPRSGSNLAPGKRIFGLVNIWNFGLVLVIQYVFLCSNMNILVAISGIVHVDFDVSSLKQGMKLSTKTATCHQFLLFLKLWRMVLQQWSHIHFAFLVLPNLARHGCGTTYYWADG